MSRFSDTPRTIFASKTTYEALYVESGEESEDDEHSSDLELLKDTSIMPQEHESPKMTKSAIKRANRLARIERKQRQKAKSPLAEDEPSVRHEEDAFPPPTQAVAPAMEYVEDLQPPRSTSDETDLEAVLPPNELNASTLQPQSVVRPPKPVNIFADSHNDKTSSSSPPLPFDHQVVPIGSSIVVSGTQTNGSARQDALNTAEASKGLNAEQVKKRQNALTRTLWTFIMIGGFLTLLVLGHSYMILLVMLCQTLVYREVTALFSLKTAISDSQDASQYKGKDPWSKTLNWYFFAVTNYFLYGESIIYYFKHVVFADANLLPFATNHRMISFTLYIIGFMGFVMSLKKGFLKQQFGLFCWVHMSLLLIVVSSHFIVNNILEGLIWFWVPASLVICNDCFAYIWGITIGRTPLIKLSPKKTVEGFVGAFLSTIVFALAWGTFFMRFNYMICPVHDLGVSAFSSTSCTPNPVFVWRNVELWRPLSSFLSVFTGSSITRVSYAPYQLHLLVLACFASLVAPFGGFFASGFKRAFNIKDFGHSIPGHGGMTDRMDCQFLMGVFTYVYYSSLIRVNNITVGKILETVVSGLTVEQQLELIRDLSRYLEQQGISV